MENRVMQQLFRQVITRVDTQFEVRVPPFAEKPSPMLDECHFTKERTGITELDRNRR